MKEIPFPEKLLTVSSKADATPELLELAKQLLLEHLEHGSHVPPQNYRGAKTLGKLWCEAWANIWKPLNERETEIIDILANYEYSISQETAED